MLLNKACKVLGIVTISQGGICGTVVDLRLLFAIALKACATSIIVAHNHPSANLTPSNNDIAITERIRQAGRILDIELRDHFIITEEGYYSFAEEGKL